MKVFAIYDSAVSAYLQPFFLRSKGEALRALVDLVNDPKSNVNAHPSDFTLFQLGEYDDQTGKFDNEATPVSLGVAIEFLKEPPRTNPFPGPVPPTPAKKTL